MLKMLADMLSAAGIQVKITKINVLFTWCLLSISYIKMIFFLIWSLLGNFHIMLCELHTIL